MCMCFVMILWFILISCFVVCSIVSATSKSFFGKHAIGSLAFAFALFTVILFVILLSVPCEKMGVVGYFEFDAVDKTKTHVIGTYRGEAVLSKEIQYYSAETNDIVLRQLTHYNHFGKELEDAFPVREIVLRKDSE